MSARSLSAVARVLALPRAVAAPAGALGAVLLLAGALLLAAAGSSSAQPEASPAQPGLQAPEAVSQEAGGALVDIVEADGVLDGTVAGYLIGVLDDAAAAGAEVVVLQLDVRGAIGDAGTRVAEAVAASEVPVVTWVGPPGSRATGAGLLVAQAGQLRAAAPGTLLGPGLPVDLAGAGAGRRTAYERLTQASTLEHALGGGALAIAPAAGDQALPPDAALPPGLAFEDVRVVDEEAAVVTGLLDLTAPTLADLLPMLEGREVTVGGETVVLDVDPVTARPRFNNLGLLRQVLHAVAGPALAYLLLVAGALALLFEVFQPGFGVAGVSGIATAGLGLYGFVVLPTRWVALAVLVAGLLLLAADLALGRLGLLTASGAAAFAGGSWWLLPGPEPLVLPGWLVALATVTVVVYFVGVLTPVLRAQGNQAMTGAERVVGETGVVRSMLNPEGHVFVGGALWRARAPDDAGRVKAGTPVRVVGLNDSLTLDVVPLTDGEGAATEPPSRSGVR